MSGTVSFLKGISSGWVQLLTVAVLQFAQVRVAREWFSEEEFVLFNVLANLVGLFLVLEFGIRSAFARLLLDAEAEGGGAVERVWSTAKCILVIQAIVMLLIGGICVPFVPRWFNASGSLAAVVQWVFSSLCFLTAAGYACNTHMVALIARQKFVLVNTISIISSIVSFACFYWTLRSGGGLWSAVAAAIPIFATSTWIAPFITKRLRISRPFAFRLITWTDLRKVLTLGFDLFWIGLYNLLLAHSLLVFAGGMLPAAAAASFSVNLKFVQFAIQALQRMPGTAEPILCQLLTQNEAVRLQRAWQMSAKAALLATGAVAGALYLWTGWIVAHWTSRADVIHGVPLLLLTLIPVRYVVHTLFVHSASIFKAADQLRVPLLIELCIFGGLVAALTPVFGLSGLLLANMLALAVGSLIPGIRLLGRVGGFPIRALVGILCRVTVPLTAALILVSWLVPRPDELPQLGRIGLTVGWLMFTFLIGRFLGFSAEDRMRIFTMVGLRRFQRSA